MSQAVAEQSSLKRSLDTERHPGVWSEFANLTSILILNFVLLHIFRTTEISKRVFPNRDCAEATEELARRCATLIAAAFSFGLRLPMPRSAQLTPF